MHQINPKKLLLSKWTATQPKNKELHFIVSKLIKNEENEIIACELEAIINKKSYEIDWKELKNTEQWRIGWK